VPEAHINTQEFIRGTGVSIGERTSLGAIGGPAVLIELGDHVQIEADVRILAPRVYIGDYTRISHHVTIYGYDSVFIGPCGWIGQNVILNSTAPLTISRGCTISAYANVWTHFSGGDPVEGCRFDSNKPCSIGADVWLGVQCSVAPVSIGDKALVLAGGVVTKDIPGNTVWGGNPAVDLTEKLGPPYIQRTAEEKFALLCHLLRRFHHCERGYQHGLSQRLPELLERRPAAPSLTLGGITVALNKAAAAEAPAETSVFQVNSRSYSKLGTPDETAFMKFLLPMVKFYPESVAGK
jgi:acetyltransferase-like isoleucine patch superfamily enzyme